MRYDLSNAPGVRVGMGIASFVGLLSFIGSGVLLAFSLTRLFKREDYDPLQPVTVLFMYWIVCDLLSALSTMANLRWALQGAAEEGGYCRAQAICRLIGDSGSALCVFTISLLVLVRIVKPSAVTTRSRQISLALVSVISLILLLIILVPSTIIGGYFGVTDNDMWCWIVDRATLRLRLGTVYVLMWIALGTETLVYGYLLLRKLAHNYHWFGITSSFDSITSSAALGMFWYAVAYAIEIIPLSIVRARQFGHHNVSHGWDAVVLILLGAAGFVNALLFFTTGRRFGFSNGSKEAVSPPTATSEIAVSQVV